MSYAKELAFAKVLALEAGGIMKRYFRAEDIGHSWKEDNTPLTIADTTINKLVIDQVKENFPEHGVLGEEESYEPGRETIWVLDPIDGTVPYSLGIPISTFSLALVHRHDGQPVLAVTYDPQLDELFSATKGDGAFLNDKPIHTTRRKTLAQGYLHMGALNVQEEGIDYNAGTAMVKVRSTGAKVISVPSSVYIVNRIAAGQFIGGIIGHPKSWDVAASALLVEEAGGIVTDLKGERRRYDEDGLGAVFAANPTIYEKLMKIVRDQNADIGD